MHLRIFLIAGVSALALPTLAAPANAQEATSQLASFTRNAAGEIAAPGGKGTRGGEIVVTAQTPPQDVPGGKPAAKVQAGTPPSEAVQERAPANPAVRAYPRQADGHGIKLGGYNVSRWAEDWRNMRDPAKRDDPLDRLKYIPVDANGDIYLTLSGEARLRSNLITNPNLVDSEYRRENQLRLFGGGDLHVGPLRFFGELAHGGVGGHNYGVPPARTRNRLAVQQAFAELSGEVGGYAVGIRYGRQEFTDGSAGLVSQKDDNSIHTSLSGVRGWAQASRYRIDLFDFEAVRLGTGGTGDDVSDSGTRFSGVTAGVVLADEKKKKVFLDPFVWRERNDTLRWGRTTGREIRHYYGARLWGSLDRLTFDWMVNHQDGAFAGRDIDAWSANIAQTYVLDAKGWAPKAGIHFDYGSGGGAFGTDTVNTARTPTAGMIAYSYQGALNLMNLFQVSPNFTVSPMKTLDVTTEFQHSLRSSTRDAVYRSSGSAYVGSQNAEGRHVGDAIRLQASWKVTPRLSLVARYEYFMPGTVLDELDLAASHYAATWVSFRF